MTFKLIDTMELEMLYEDELEYSDILEIKLENANSILNTFIGEYEQRYTTKIKGIASIGKRTSFYGTIGGNNQIVGTSSETIDFNNLIAGCDHFEIQVNDDKTITVIKHDHDGSNYMDLVLITNSELKSYYQNEYDYFNLAEFVFERKKQPTKLFGSVLVYVKETLLNIA